MRLAHSYSGPPSIDGEFSAVNENWRGQSLMNRYPLASGSHPIYFDRGNVPGCVKDRLRYAFALTSTPASFSSVLIRAEAFSFPKPSPTACSRFFWTTRSAGIGELRLLLNC